MSAIALLGTSPFEVSTFTFSTMSMYVPGTSASELPRALSGIVLKSKG